MNWCADHWTRLRLAVEAREGLSALIATSGERAAENLAAELKTGKADVAHYDPLMAAFWAINANCTRIISESLGPGPGLYLLAGRDVPEDPVDAERFPDGAGRTWPRCPLCYLGLVHELTCEGCDMPKEDGFAWMIERAADDQAENWAQMKADEQDSSGGELHSSP